MSTGEGRCHCWRCCSQWRRGAQTPPVATWRLSWGGVFTPQSALRDAGDCGFPCSRGTEGGGQYLWMGVSVKAGTPPHFSFAPQRPRLLPSNTASTPWECPKYAAKGTRSWGLVRGLDSLSGVPGVYDICDHTKHVPENTAVVGSDSQRGPGTGNPGRELPTVGPRRRSVRVRQSLLSCSRRRPTTTVRRSRDH